MKHVLNTTISDIQDISQFVDVLLDLCREPPTQKVLDSINKQAKAIKNKTKKYMEV